MYYLLTVQPKGFELESAKSMFIFHRVRNSYVIVLTLSSVVLGYTVYFEYAV